MSARKDKPQVLTANLLKGGNVVFLAGDGTWTSDIGQADIAETAEAATGLEKLGAFSTENNIIVDPYLIEVAIEADGRVRPVKYREFLRTQGPTVRRDLGYQAEAAKPVQ